MKLWEAELSSSELTDTEPNKTCNYSNLLVGGSKISEAET